ncbi:MAG TPA: GNVR domain-containing protein [Candidatus Aquilonibacter sp.]|jgi:polysaccharide chain length determinant protein (PEP-CTERM system associated)|nr:GNVR domain-containing protein [Candidatus Aquilonibacter sp.]
MVRNGEIALADVKRVFRRYWWIPAFMTVTLGVIGLAASLVLPKKYTSSTLVLVEQPTVPKDLIKPVITDDLNERMASMKAQILSRSRLESIINKFGLYPRERQTTHMEDLVEKLKAAIDVELIQPMAGSTNHEPPGFNVSVTFDNPQLAQQICQEITSMFMEQNATGRVAQSNKVSQFLTEQLNEAKAKLEEQDKGLAKFKAEHLVSMPEQEQTNLTLLSGMNTQLDATTQALTRAQQDKTLNETLLSQQEANWKLSQAGQQNPETQDQELAALESQLAALQAKYTPEHPDVIKLKTQIEDLKRRMGEAPAPKAAPSAAQISLREPPSIQQLRTKIKQDEFTISDMTKRQSQIQDQIRAIQGRLQASPVVEQQLKELTRSYQTASDIYNELLKKRENSAMATDLEHEQQGENFRVLDSPSLPLTPSFPKKIVFVGGSLGAGLALSLGILYLLAVSDKAMYSERDVELCMKLPVLTTVPSFDVRAQGNG